VWATILKTTFSRHYALPIFRHSFMSVRRLDDAPRNEKNWDEAVFKIDGRDCWLLTNCQPPKASDIGS